MRIAVISDIHGNLEAFRSVLADLDGQRPEAVYCLGDTVGYGADPEAAVRLLTARGIRAVAGNHELAVLRPRRLRWFNPVARQSLEWTAGNLSARACDFLATLPVSRVRAGCRFVHGFPPGSVLTYLFQVSDRRIMRVLGSLREKVCFVGHTHDLELIRLTGTRIEREELGPGLRRRKPGERWIVNIGSVGQPRDGDHRAKYVIWDGDRQTLALRRIGYDNHAAADKIRAAGLPSHHARMLGG